ncbi:MULTISPECIES: DUF6124 family protein [Pseudomonas]|uniref:DUF6124 family protein n=1 Tax=Pseudomonas TaxID=286 RepID=UPI000B88CF32|nr:DUF3077 domain-containing protein [Pseudomonas marginalis]TWR67018.1 DUF3077 domain-containing protein [Pseudomonas marginalis]
MDGRRENPERSDRTARLSLPTIQKADKRPQDAPPFILNDNLSLEDALAHAADLLHCAVGTAHLSGEGIDVQQRAVMHLVEMAKGVVDRALECVQPR